MSYWQYFHTLTKKHTDRKVVIPANEAEWPEEWKTIFFKKYPDLEHISFETNIMPPSNLFEAIAKRQSTRKFGKDPISKADLGNILLYACGIQKVVQGKTASSGITERQHRAQPSGGGRFPVEAYVLNFVDGEIPAGVFHYDVQEHQLSVLEKRSFSKDEVNSLFLYPFVAQATYVIVLTSLFQRTTMKYGERGYRFSLLEAGHIGQNVSLVSEALGLGYVMMAGFNAKPIEKLLDIDGVTESVIYTAVLGSKC